MIYCYERVSTKHQDERRQEISLEKYKIDRKFIDKLTGGNKDRPQLQKMFECFKAGDTVVVESISRFARNTRDLLELVDMLAKKQVKFISAKENIDTGTPTGQFMLTVFAAMYQLEREMIVERVHEGMEKAKRFGTRSGKPIGRPRLDPPKGFEKYYAKVKNKELTMVEFARLLNVARGTAYGWVKVYDEQVAANDNAKSDEKNINT